MTVPTSAPPSELRRSGLTYANDRSPGMMRLRRGKGFSYRAASGGPVTDPATVARINALAIPPAWTQVWICPTEDGHIQATGRDAKGRKQYIYHPLWQALRNESKYDKLVEIAGLLPALRERIDADMRRPVPSRPRVLASVVRLLETTLIRVGNPEYAKTNESYGLTTLRNEHVEVQGAQMHFSFRGKSGKTWRLKIADRRIANAVRACQELPGQNLFEYVEAGERYAITSGDVNAYLRETNPEISAKDLRTWAGTVLMAIELAQAEPARSPTHAKRVVSAAVKQVAHRLGNTPSVCRKSYVHPRIIDAYVDGSLAATFDAARSSKVSGLRPDEFAVLQLLKGDGTVEPASAVHRVDSTVAPRAA